jgi:hypothetical protein
MKIIRSGKPDRMVTKGECFPLPGGEKIQDSSWDQRGEDFEAPAEGCWLIILEIGCGHTLSKYLVLSDEERSVLKDARASFPAPGEKTVNLSGNSQVSDLGDNACITLPDTFRPTLCDNGRVEIGFIAVK